MVVLAVTVVLIDILLSWFEDRLLVWKVGAVAAAIQLQAQGKYIQMACLYDNFPGLVFLVAKKNFVTDWVKKSPDTVQRLVNASYKALLWIRQHTPEEITEKMPAEFYAKDKALYLEVLKSSMPLFSRDGKVPADGPETILARPRTTRSRLPRRPGRSTSRQPRLLA